MLARTLLRTHARPAGLSARALAPARTFSTSLRYLKPAVETISTSTPPPPPPSMKAGKGEGTIASVFATLSGGTLEDALPDRFADLKRSLVTSPSHAERLQTTWRSVLSALSARVAETERLGGDSIPEVTFPTTSNVGPLQSWTDASTYGAIQQRGVAVIRNVIPSDQVLAWKEDIKAYAARNNAKGFPDDNPQVYELYWTPAQQAARTHPNLLTTSERFLQLFHQPASNSALSVDTTAVLGQPLNYCDRLRIRQPGDAKFALGAHIDGGGVERWECDNFRGLWSSILQEKGDWTKHDPWSLGANGERMTAKTDMYDGPGQCAVFRPLQGWLSMSTTRAGEGTLKVLPFLRESTAYIVLRPFFTPLIPRAQCSSEAQFLHADNWVLDTTSRRFPGCSLGHNIELSTTTHPHLALDKTMTSIPHVNPGDMVLWHCDAVHSVENTHRGKSDSSVLYIPAIPTTKVNWSYIMNQRQCFERGIPPPDFPGGKGESDAHGRATPDQVAGQKARTSLGLAKFNLDAAISAPERALLEWCNSQL